jgi:ubiquinone biosynthesis protein UbiJ
MRAPLALFNHVLNQHPALCAALAVHAGRRVALSLGPVELAGVVTPQGWLAETSGMPEASISVRPWAALQAQWSGQAPGFDDLSFAGDAALAESVAQVLGQLRWEPADDLARLFGDTVAHRIERGVQAAVGFKGQIAWRIVESWVEHWRDESPLLARKLDIEHYMTAVDSLRDDSERLEKRIERLEAGTSSVLNQRSRVEAGGQ